ncbi:MAG: hypothetical protein O9353_15620, partial [Bacteroidia bacterium]|nr:hypothetical protein [Bacteroidia bacterium]
IAVLSFSACKKDKKTEEPVVDNPIPITNPPEVITTVRLALKDSATNVIKTYAYKDPDGDGGTAGSFLNESGTHDTLMLLSNTTYFTQVYILDESKNPTDSTSNVIAGAESNEHMLFFNGNPAATGNNANTILNSNVPYTVQTNGSNVAIKYLDIDNGNPQRSLGLKTRWRTAASSAGITYPLTVTLKHQPGVKNGTYSPGETDVELTFKVKIN